jgi:hypothetical protein
MSGKEINRAEVLSRVKRRDLKLVEAAELLRLSYRQTRRVYRRYLAAGVRGLVHAGRGRRGPRARPEELRQRIVELVRGRYGGPPGRRLGPKLASELLEQEHGLAIAPETLRRWMLAEGLWSRRRASRKHRARRERKRHFGELVQMDGSFHHWLEDRAGVGCLMDMNDDATGTTQGRFEAEETTWAAADLLRRWVERYGIPRALYTDYKNVYVRRATTREQLDGEAPRTQFGQMCARLGTEIIPASSPQAKGRIERGHGTHQDRLVKKMRLRGIGDYATANAYLEADYWAEHNRRFGREAASAGDYHRRVPRGMNLDEVFSLREERVLSQDWVVRYANRSLQVSPGQRVRPGQRITVEEQRSGKVRLLACGRELRWHEIAPPLRPAAPPTRLAAAIVGRRKPVSPAGNHPWRRRLLHPRPRADDGAEMPGGYAALGNPADLAGFPHSHTATTT